MPGKAKAKLVLVATCLLAVAVLAPLPPVYNDNSLTLLVAALCFAVSLTAALAFASAIRDTVRYRAQIEYKRGQR